MVGTTVSPSVSEVRKGKGSRMTDTEKLTELLRPWIAHLSLSVAKDLIANGVTFATDTNAGSKWISVEDRLPEHGDVVLCHHKHTDYPIVCQWDERTGAWIDDKWSYGTGCITHWMPLPEPPTD